MVVVVVVGWPHTQEGANTAFFFIIFFFGVCDANTYNTYISFKRKSKFHNILIFWVGGFQV